MFPRAVSSFCPDVLMQTASSLCMPLHRHVNTRYVVFTLNCSFYPTLSAVNTPMTSDCSAAIAMCYCEIKNNNNNNNNRQQCSS